MNTSKDVRTTVTFPEDLLFELKKKALLGRKSLKNVIIDGLTLYLYPESRNDKRGSTVEREATSLFGAWGKGPSGITSVATMRYGKAEKKREDNITKEWKKS